MLKNLDALNIGAFNILGAPHAIPQLLLKNSPQPKTKLKAKPTVLKTFTALPHYILATILMGSKLGAMILSM